MGRGLAVRVGAALSAKMRTVYVIREAFQNTRCMQINNANANDLNVIICAKAPTHYSTREPIVTVSPFDLSSKHGDKGKGISSVKIPHLFTFVLFYSLYIQLAVVTLTLILSHILFS